MQAYQLESAENRRDDAHAVAEQYAGFFKFIMESYQSYFSEFFQEVYDPLLGSCKAELFEDRPAGFRLVYKHGRRDPKTWTSIVDRASYIGALVDFIRMVEGRLIADCNWDVGKKEIGAITTFIIQHLETDQFFLFAQDNAHKLHTKAQTQAVQATPWSYISGGSMETLLKCYFRIEGSIHKEQRIVESPFDLLTFWIEALKNAPANITNSCIEDESSVLYAFSPSHAFLLQPGLFKEAWMSKQFTYTWVRDHVVKPARLYYQDMSLSLEDQEFITFKMKEVCGLELKASHLRLNVANLRQHFAQQSADLTAIDSCLMRFLPLYNQTSAQQILCHLGLETHYPLTLMTACELADLTFALTRDESIRYRLSALGYLPPKPFFVADTNWPGMWFAFAYNPGTQELDLWRSDPSFRNPKPMHVWRKDLDGTSHKPWGILLPQFVPYSVNQSQ